LKKVSIILPQSIEQREILKSARAQLLFKNWPDIVGEFLASKSVPDRFEKGVLWVIVENSVWAQELRLQEELIMDRLNDISGESQLFKSIRVAIRPGHKEVQG
jgi:predicted nucleic acid-binding Zn ribbon protein